MSHYRRTDRDSDDLEPVESCAELEALGDRGAAIFQIASALYDNGLYRLPDLTTVSRRSP